MPFSPTHRLRGTWAETEDATQDITIPSNVNEAVREALAMKQRMQRWNVWKYSSRGYIYVREALGLKQRMQLGFTYTFTKNRNCLRGTCDETEDATMLLQISWIQEKSLRGTWAETEDATVG